MPQKLLLIEDEERMAQSLVKGLTKSGYEVVWLANGWEIDKQNLEEYSLAIVDWMLPGASGLDIIRKWRRNKVELPVLMLTAKGQTADKVLGLEFGADDYLTKFFEWDELVARVGALIRRSSKNKAVLQLGPIRLEKSKNQFYEDNKLVELTKTEYKILEYFFNFPDKVSSREQLFEAIYYKDYEANSNVLERHIKSIRKKFKYDPILTIYGHGYRLKTADPI
jgi:two-component system response regulator PhoP